MPPSGLLMSTFSRSPLLRSLMEQPAMGKAAAIVREKQILFSLRISTSWLSSGRHWWNQSRLLDAGAARRDVGNGHRQMSANREFGQQRLHRADLRNRGVGKCAQIILHFRKTRSQIRS